MAKFVSRRAEVGLARESSRGIFPGTVAHWIPWSSVSFGDRAEEVIEESALGRIESSDYAYNTIKYAQGSIEADIRAAYFGLILANLLGAAPTTSGGNPYTHTYALAQNNQHQSLSILIQDKTNTDINKMFMMAMIDRYEMVIESGQLVRNTIDFIAQAGRDWTSQSSSFTALGSKFLHQHAHVKVAANTAGLAAASELSVRSLNLVIEKNILRNDVLGTVAPEDLNNQSLRITGTMVLNYEDATWLNYMLAKTDRALEIVLNAGSSAILTLQFPLVHFMGWEKDMAPSEIARQKIEFVAHYDAPNNVAAISTCTLVNAVSSY